MKGIGLACLISVLLQGQVVEESFSRDPGPLDFLRGEGHEQFILQSLTGDALVGLDARLHVVPRLAIRWYPEDKGLRFELRNDAHFADGSPVTPEDILWTFQQIQSDPKASPTKRAIVEGLKIRMEKGGVILESPKPNQRLLMELARIPITRKGRSELGSGPFALRKDRDGWKLTKRKHFLNPRIEGLRFRLLGDQNAVFQALKKKWLSIGVPPPRSGDPQPGFRQLVQSMHAQLVVWNQGDPNRLRWLEHWRKDAFPARLLGERAKPSRGLWPETLGFVPRAIKCTRPLPPVRGQTWVLSYPGAEDLIQTALLALRARAAQDGVKLELRPFEPSLLFGKLQKGDFEMAAMLVLFDPHPWSVLEYTDPSGPMNFTHWKPARYPEIAGKLDQAGNAAWRELEELWATQPAAIPILDFQSVIWVDQRLQVSGSALGLYGCTPGAAGWFWQR